MSRMARQSDGTYMVDGLRFQTNEEAGDYMDRHPKAAASSEQPPAQAGLGSFAAIIGLGLLASATFAIGSGTNNIAAVATVVHFVSLIALYFAPTYVAHSREHGSRTGITVLNVLLGWTVLGWLIALIWAYSGEAKRTEAEPRPARDAAPSTCAAAPPQKSMDAGEKLCPFCAETVKVAAIKCKHCGSDLTAQPVPN
ncbi:MAG TPA: superinfection immunity protein [Ramlibacter sp.]|nr:superinfection immunity protein [Ramlibacter sp.]